MVDFPVGVLPVSVSAVTRPAPSRSGYPGARRPVPSFSRSHVTASYFAGSFNSTLPLLLAATRPSRSRHCRTHHPSLNRTGPWCNDLPSCCSFTITTTLSTPPVCCSRMQRGQTPRSVRVTVPALQTTPVYCIPFFPNDALAVVCGAVVVVVRGSFVVMVDDKNVF